MANDSRPNTREEFVFYIRQELRAAKWRSGRLRAAQSIDTSNEPRIPVSAIPGNAHSAPRPQWIVSRHS